MADWLSPMQQTFEYYRVDPGTWKDVSLLSNVKTCTITRDSDAETLGSATLDVDGLYDEMYVRAYLVTVQNGVRERHPLATMLVQTPSTKFDGFKTSASLDCYTPLIELKENQPPLGYYSAKETNIMEEVARLTQENLRAPVVPASSETTLYQDFVANTDDTWLSYISDLALNDKFYFDLDELGRVLYAPKQDTAAIQPVWTYTDDNSSILYPEIDLSRDLYGIPNVVEVIYSDSKDLYYARVVNDDPNSPISTVKRGREITQRIENPSFPGEPTQAMINEYAEQQLRALSTLEYTLNYKHGYNGVRLGDCVRMDYNRAGIAGIKARVIYQSISCEPGCPVSEKAVFTMKLWR